MKKYILLLITLFVTTAIWAQSDDDMYFVPKKKVQKEVQKNETYYVGSDRDVDEYNRHGALVTTVEELNDDDDVIDLDAVLGEYPDSLYADEDYEDIYYDEYDNGDDYCCTRNLCRWYDCWTPYYTGWWGWYNPWYWGWYSPWYYSWYSPWYWGGWYYPSAWWGWHGGIEHGWLAAGGRGRGYSNRGGGHLATSGALGATGRRNAGNVYNNIAKRSAANNTNRKGINSSRTMGQRTTPSSSTRTYSPSNSSRSNSFGGTRSSFGGSRGGSFGGGARSGGGHGGRR